MSNFGFIDDAIYDLKQRYPGEVIFHRITETIVPQKLKKTTTKVTKVVRQAVVLPENSQRQFIARLANLVANREFTYGQWFDQGMRTVLIDIKDLGTFAPVQDSDFMVFENARWEVQRVDAFGPNALAITGRRVGGSKPEAVFEKRARNRLMFGQSAGHTIA